MNNLTCNCVPRLDGVSAAELGRLFPEPSTTAPFFLCCRNRVLTVLTCGASWCLKDDVPILLLPLFETRFDLSTFVEGWIKKSLKVAGRLIPSIFQPRVLSVGLVVGEWSEIGIDPQIDEGTLDAACKMAFGALQTLAAELKSDIVALYNFNHYGKLPGEVFKKFNRVQYRSCARLPINFNSMEEFLSPPFKGREKRPAPQNAGCPRSPGNSKLHYFSFSGQDLQALSGNSGAQPHGVWRAQPFIF